MEAKKEEESDGGRRKSLIKETVSVPPDGGWGWVVALGAFQTMALAPMIGPGFSILFSKLMSDNNASTATIAWIFNLMQMFWNITSFIAAPLSAEIGWRKVTFTGGLFMGASIILSSFATVPEMLFFTIVLVYGFGAGLSLTTTLVIVPQYFEKRRGFANGFVSAGMCSGQFTAPLLIRTLQETYGHEPAIAIFGAILLNVCVSAMVYHPVEWHSKRKLKDITDNSEEIAPLNECSNGDQTTQRESKAALRRSAKNSVIYGSAASLPHCSRTRFPRIRKRYSVNDENKCKIVAKRIISIGKLIIHDLSLLKYARVMLITISFSLLLVVYMNFLMIAPLVIQSKGYDLDVAAYCLTITGVCNIIVRVTVSTLTDFFSVKCKWYFMSGCLIISAAILSMSLATEKLHLMLSMGLFGVGVGCCITLLTLLVIEVVGLKMLASVIGANGLISGTFFVTIGPLIGFIRDLTLNYNLCLQIMAVLQLTPFVLWVFMPAAIAYDSRKEKLKQDASLNENI